MEMIFSLIAIAAITGGYAYLAQAGTPQANSLVGYCLGIVGFLIQAPVRATAPASAGDTTAAIGRALVGPFAVTLELLGVLLVASLLGALYFARSEE